jgi:hypothetical protein
MAPDAPRCERLLTWPHSTVYPTNTSTTSGTADFGSCTGRLITSVPEPSTYGAILMGAGLAAYGLRRRFGRGAATGRS